MAQNRNAAGVRISSAILAVLVVAAAVATPAAASAFDTAPHLHTTMKSVNSFCQATDFKESCQQSLHQMAGNSTAPNQLVVAGFEAAIAALQGAIANSSVVQEAARDPMAKQALENCKSLMNTAIEDLRASIKEVGDLDITKIEELLDNLKTWLTAAITYQQTCIEGFDNTTGNAGEKMRQILVTSSQLSSNGLAMISGLSSLFSSFNLSALTGRKLLAANADDAPVWVSPAKKRLLAATPATIKPDVVVAQDGSGQFKTIDEAIKNIPKNRTEHFVIHIKAGVYNEKITFDRASTNVMIIGDGPTKTKITGNASFAGGIATLNTATVAVSGAHFIAKDIGFENTAGAIGHQAVALKVQSDMSVFYNCQIDGYQSTLFSHTYRQFYRDCQISGTVDTVFGDSSAVFQNCKFIIRKPMDLQKCTVTAQGRNNSRQTSGFIIMNSTITADQEYLAVKETNPAFLGRPQNPYSRTVIMRTEISDAIDPKGWVQWMGTFGTDTCYYAEFENKGPGAATNQRVDWPGVKKITAAEATGFSAGKFIDGDSWITNAGVPYNAGIN